MAMQQMSSASSSSAVAPLKKSDVFISFRGEDTRRSFTSHLYDALSKKVITFIDDNELQKGDEISSALIKAIEESYASIVIFSIDYASSKWCLNELVKILECKKDHGQIVIPVFYEIDPSHVRNQTGRYSQAFAKHEQDLKHGKDMLQKWKDALIEAANLAGWHSQNYRTESNFIKDIVEDVLKKLNRKHPFEVNKELVGIDKKCEEVESLMKIGSNDVKTLGFWGMGGIGKTTLAKDLYAKLCSQFERHCFIENVREESTRRGLNVLRNKLFSTLLELRLDAPYVETPMFIRRLACEKSFIVLDDVATLEQAEYLNIGKNCLGPGSRVIVTTRDKQICSQFDECAIYEVKGLNIGDSLQLFCRNAFGEKHPKDGYEDLSKSAIGYCRGNPLALKVLGANFRTKSKEAWASELEKIKKIPYGRIHDVLKLSFDDLDRTQEDIFLDIACFSYSKLTDFDYFSDRDYLTVLLNACNFFALSGIEVLLHKALINLTFTFNNEIEMHDLLVEMGREIVKQESPKNPGRRSRLWDPEEVYDVLKNNMGSEVIEVIIFNISKTRDLYLSSDSFKNMTNLRYLHITDKIKLSNGRKCYNVHLLEGLEWLSDKLRHLYWEAFPLESLPSTFCAEWLVQLSMRHSKLKKLWNEIQKLDNLMIIMLDYSKDLIEIPDLSKAPKLELVSLSYCESLCQLHPSIFTAPKLRELYLKGCKKIESLKTNIHSKSLRTLELTDCSSLKEFSVTSEEMMSLSLCGTAIHELPSSIWRNWKLTYRLDLSECKKLNIVGKKLTNDPGLESLTVLDLSGCTQINTSNLWFILDGIQSLKRLNLRKCCNLETLPNNIQSNSMLQRLNLDECRKLKSLPKLPASLQNLRAINCHYLDTNSIQRPMLENILHRLHINYGHRSNNLDDFSFLPGTKVPCEFDFQTIEASIVIPPIPKHGLGCFVFCIVLSKGLNVKYDSVCCTIYEHRKKVHQWDIDCGSTGTLFLDHVLLICWCGNKKLVEVRSESGGEHYNLSFEFKFKHYVDDKETWSTKGIKGCGIFPVYGLEHNLGLNGRSNRRVEIVELQSNAQVSDESDQHSQFDIDELQHRTTIGGEVRVSTHENDKTTLY
ncbi:putative TIR domain, P-loop containing nucleoside triphosphate hydrolase [Medicago truncatula]|uniref:Disease resistance protein (TIR-NBS-LRR class), putative n=1 Tax=Medicago truncatula TaxID=3880 RepID=A0A072UIC3_MEDTR|nr:disease resistance protein RPV1 [Medicago truncatula]XP_024636876.1 disease resistance protein RPV1 [Medicago truncatula]XP_039689947.1 disease resistance protein RPV1 [Medicago truncatula]KEH29387.1 disease resistance protein (TIR-NBS-LRR class), putative [Medicago truncatula]RHN59825.1 putative TIR domain, P-loop containing nucleoside triphosphate hydrolase [Medicago truncatula]